MSYGIIEYNTEGQPKCEICGKHFERVLRHVNQKHDMMAIDYKDQFGFDRIKGICSKESAERTRYKTYQNYDKCIKKNLEEAGTKSRFTKGCKGRTKDMISDQTMNRLISHFNVIGKLSPTRQHEKP